MHPLLSFVVVLVVGGLLWLLIGYGLLCYHAARANSRRSGIAAERLMAERQIDALTRETIAAMREAVRQHGQGFPQ